MRVGKFLHQIFEKDRFQSYSVIVWATNKLFTYTIQLLFAGERNGENTLYRPDQYTLIEQSVDCKIL